MAAARFHIPIVKRFTESAAPYVFLARNAFLTSISFRLRTLLFILAGAIDILVQLFLWRALYSAGGAHNDVTFSDMTSYVVLNALLSPLFNMRVGERLAVGIYDGSIAADLLKPLRLKLMYAAHETGGLLAELFIRALPPALAWGFILRVSGPASPAALAGALFTLILGILLSRRVEMIIGQLAFWLQDFWYLKWFHRALVALFSGSLVPLWFYPAALQGIAAALPFRFTAFVPISLYLGKTPVDALPGLTLSALAWLLALGLLEQLVWRRGVRRIVVLGG